MKKYIFKKLIISAGSIFITVTGCFAQTSTKNYVTTYLPQVVVTNEWAIPGLAKESGQKTITYSDGLGRPSQVVQISSSPTGFDMIAPIKYDAFGREARKFLPYTLTSANNGAYVTTDSIGQGSYYTGLYGTADGTTAFVKSEFEPSPLNRILKHGAPGSTWQPNIIAASDHAIKFDYSANIAIDSVRMWLVGSNNIPTSSAFYPVNSLLKTTSWDENNNKARVSPNTLMNWMAVYISPPKELI